MNCMTSLYNIKDLRWNCGTLVNYLKSRTGENAVHFLIDSTSGDWPSSVLGNGKVVLFIDNIFLNGHSSYVMQLCT